MQVADALPIMNDTTRRQVSPSVNLRVRSSIRAGETKKGDKGDKQQDYLIIKLNEVLISSY